LLEFLANLGITPNMLTVSGLIFMSLAGLLFALDQIMVGLGALILGACFDSIDGSLAHVTGLESPQGAFLDSICDHCGDFAIYLGLLEHYLKTNAHIEVIFLFFAMFGSVFGSLIRARASMAGIDIKDIGVFTRFERLLVLFVGILMYRIDVAIGVLAIFNTLSAFHRVFFTLSRNWAKEGKGAIH
jgi:phosphatidylglycerophosphate synthase